MNKNTLKQKNILREILLGDDVQKVNRATVEAVFRSLIEPMVEKCNNCAIFTKLEKGHSFENILKRINFINSNIYSFSAGMDFLKNVQVNPILAKTEFLIVLSERYSSLIVWDYSLGEEFGYEENSTPFYILMNSKKINDITEELLQSVDLQLDDVIKKYTPERRQNEVMNFAVENLIKALNNSSEEVVFAEAEKNAYSVSSIEGNIKNISHEIKNHLSIIDLYSKIIEKKIELSEKEKLKTDCKNSINSIRTSISSISFLLNSLKNQVVERQEFDLHSVVNKVVTLFEAKLENVNIQISVDIKERIMILVDEIKFQNVILNMLCNAVEAMTDKGKIKISARVENNFAKLFIENDGEKISESAVKNLFSSGFTTKATGQGLGLSICKETMTQSGGDIRLLSSDDKSTVFELAIPLAK